MTARVKKVIEEMAELSPPELAELAQRFQELRAVNDQGRRVCRGADGRVKFFVSARLKLVEQALVDGRELLGVA
jgi:hypothetical protein